MIFNCKLNVKYAEYYFEKKKCSHNILLIKKVLYTVHVRYRNYLRPTAKVFITSKRNRRGN